MPHWWGTPIDEKGGNGEADQGVVGHYPCLNTRYSCRRVFFGETVRYVVTRDGSTIQRRKEY